MAESKLFQLAERRTDADHTKAAKDVMPATLEAIEARQTSGGIQGLETGLTDLDAMTGGMKAGEVTVLAGRTSMGKTALALNFARNAALDHDKAVAVFSLEMTTRSLVLRMLSSEAEVDFSTFHKGLISVDAHGRLAEAAGRLTRAGVYIDDTSSASVLEMRAKCRRLPAQKGLPRVVGDYLLLARGGGRTRGAVYLRGAVPVMVSFIPPSVFGSEYDYRVGGGRGTAG